MAARLRDVGVNIRVMIADDHALMRSGLAAILNEYADFVVVGEAADGAQAIAQFRRLRPDVTLMDLRMPIVDGLDATRAIRREFAQARILIVSIYRHEESMAAAFAAGARGYIDKSAAPRRLVAAIRTVHAGETYFSEGMR